MRPGPRSERRGRAAPHRGPRARCAGPWPAPRRGRGRGGWTAPTMRSRSARAASCSSGPSSPPTSAPRSPAPGRRRCGRRDGRAHGAAASRARRGLAVDEVADPLDRARSDRTGTSRRRPAGSSRSRDPQRAGQGVGQPAGLGQRHRQGSAAAGDAAAGRRRPRGRSRRAAPRPGWPGAPRSAAPDPTGVPVASSRSWRSATAFHSAIESRMSAVNASRSADCRAASSSRSSSALALVAPGAERPRGSAARPAPRAAVPRRPGAVGAVASDGVHGRGHGVRP